MKMNPEEFEFTPPPEAPVFEPNAEEFKDPLGYIAKIRPIAEKTGICKIKPPPDWQPPFAVDVENFRFTPRMQRLNELEATTRIKLNFLDQIAKFWELQGSSMKTYLRGSSLKIPNVERKALDLFTLHRVVHEEGGLEVVSRERKWARIATRMGYPAGRGVGSLLRQHYERILYPYDVFQSGATLGELNINNDSDDSEKKDKDYIPHGIPSRQAIKPPDRYARRSKRHGPDPEENLDGIDYSTNSELRKLQFYGAGPKMPGYLAKLGKYEDEDSKGFPKDYDIEEIKCGPQTKESLMLSAEAEKLGALLKRKDRPKGKRPIDQIVCTVCNRGDAEASMLLCDGCDDSYHTFCLIPPLNEIPKGDWRCPRCVAEEVCKPQEAFGFEQAQREYTLHEFGEKADIFKSDYFNMPGHRVPYGLVEKEFWRIVNAVDEDVTVEYGADLHTIDHGSGFPNKKTKGLGPSDEEYVNSGWNLNNLPVLEGSVLKHINADISGMKIPWTYVGMCFATFCWHNEDHWSYSINYLHWGEPKTWYGVPGGKAECFEDAMRSVAPELFESQPDLLHQLVTIMNPNLLISLGVPIYRTNQQAGEFVVTFPRSYHAGFNQGYNFAEAVNFAPADWLPIGRVCVSHYGMLHRFCVFSHDELVCKMASDPESLDVSIAASTYQDMLKMVETERDLRKSLLQWGITEAERENFELLPDDERQCEYCKTTCFLSAVTCACDGNKLVCVNHKDRLCYTCTPDKHVLRYRYTLDELPVMLQRLKVRAESYDNWAIRVKAALYPTDDERYDISDFKDLAQEAEEKKFPKSDLMHQLAAAVDEAEKCVSLAQQLLSRKVRTRNRQSGESKNPARLTLEDLHLFNEQLQTLVCDIKETALVKDLLERVIKFQKDAQEAVEDESVDSKRLEKLLDVSLSLDIDLPEVFQLKQKLVQRRWLEEVKESLSEPDQVTVEDLRKMLDKGIGLPPHYSVEKMLAELQELLTVSEKWEEKSKACLQQRPKLPFSAYEAILQEAGNIPVYLPNVSLLKDAAKKAREWSARVEAIQTGTHNPYLDVLEYLVIKGRPIPVYLDQLPQIENQVEAAKQWREKTARTFLKKNSAYSLLEILSPRKDIGSLPLSKSKKKKKESEESSHDDSAVLDVKFEEAKDPAAIVAAFKLAEKQELDAMQQLRAKNLRKRLEDVPDARYCVCNKPQNNAMLQCELCKDWFHMNCIPLPKSSSFKKQQSGMTSAVLSQHPKESKFLCPMCLRSRRPRLETILSLLLALQKLPVRLPEGEALQCLTERGMSWQDRARQALATEELAAALAKLSVISQRMVEQAAREKTEKIINTELMKAASNPELKPHLQSVAQSAFGGLHSKSNDYSLAPEEPNKWSSSLTLFPQSNEENLSGVISVSANEETVPSVAAVQEVSLDSTSAMDVETAADANGEPSVFIPQDDSALENPDVSANYSLEHAYSSASKSSSTSPSLTTTPRKHPRKTPLVARQMEPPVLQLSDSAIAQLEELMMEGDLLEMSLEETQHIWNILQATKMGRDSLTSVSPFSEFEDSDMNLQRKSEKKKKRKLEEIKGSKSKLLKNKVKLCINGKDGLKHKKKKLKLSNSADSESVKSKKIKSKGEGKESRKENGVHSKKDSKDGIVTKATKPKSSEKTPQKKVKKSLGKGKPDKKDKKNSAYNEPDDCCSAAKCLRPIGEAVNWVQCDAGCEQWFHLLCVGLDVTEVNETEDYICPNCALKNSEDGSEVRIKVEPPDTSLPCENAGTPLTVGNVQTCTPSSILSNQGDRGIASNSQSPLSSSMVASDTSASQVMEFENDSMDVDSGSSNAAESKLDTIVQKSQVVDLT